MKTILFPTDFSENSYVALDFASNFALATGAKILLFHSYWIPMYDFESSPVDVVSEYQNTKKFALENLAFLKKELHLKYPALEIEFQESNDLLVHSIVEIAKNTQIDLIIMGTQGASGIKSVLFGSNTAEVIKNAPCPVMAVPENSKWNGINKIVFAMDFMDSDVYEALYLGQLAKLFNAKLTFLHVTPSGLIEGYETNLIKEMVEVVKTKYNYGHIDWKILQGRDVNRHIDDYIKENQVDLLSMATKKRTLLENIFSISLTQKMAFHTEVPLLAFHARTSDLD